MLANRLESLFQLCQEAVISPISQRGNKDSSLLASITTSTVTQMKDKPKSAAAMSLV
jgi:hypothetical protein